MNFGKNLLGKCVLLVVLMCSSVVIFAQQDNRQGPPPRPPQEALDACKSLQANQECSFTSPEGKVTGTCWAPEDKPLDCKPNNAKHGPSQENQR